MSTSGIIAQNGKIFDNLLPNPYPYPAQANDLAQVLLAGNDAGNQNIENILQIETTNVVQQDQIGGHLTIGGTPSNPGSGGTLRIQGATDLGSILVGDGTDTKELVCPTTTTNATTGTIYNWLSLANGQSRDFFVSDGTLYQLGYSITIVYSGTDSITGTITAIAGQLITITITSFTSAVYTPATLITTTPPDPATATSGGGDPVFIFNPSVCTPATIPNNSFLLTGLCYLYGAPPVVGSSNITLTAQSSPPAVNGTTSIFSIPQYENPPVSTSAFSWGSAGCFIEDGTSVSLASNTGGNIIAFAFPTGGSFIDQNFTGSVSGYSLAYTPNGVITINSKLVLTADNSKPLGVFWGVDAQGVGTITSVSAGTNINVSGSLSAPIVNFATPTTSNIQLGVGTELLATAGNTTMSIDSTGLTDTYSSGGVVNLEDIAVSSTNVVQTLSTTDGSNYSNSSVLTCNQSGITDQKTATENVSNYSAGAGISCFPTATSIGCGITYPTSPPFPNADGNISIGVSSGGGSLNPVLSLTQSAPFAPTYSTTIDKNGIIQNNSSGAGFNLQTLQDLTLTCPTANKIIVPNGNDIDLSSTTGSVVHTTTYGKDGMSSADFNAGSFASTAELVQNNGNSQLFVSGSNLGAGTNNFVRVEANSGGNCAIEHNGTAGNNLNITTTGRLNMLTGTAGFLLQGNPIAGGAIQGNGGGELLESGNNIQFTSTRVGQVSQPSFTFNNQNATLGSYPAVKLDRTQGNFGAGETTSTISSFGRDASGVSREWSRIQTKTENVALGNQDGTLSIFNSVNGVVSETFNFNGGQNENNTFRPLDLNNNDIRTSTGNILLTGTLSSGAGSIELKTKDATAGSGTGLILTGNTLLNASAGGSAGTHLCLTINGTPYKIALLNP